LARDHQEKGVQIHIVDGEKSPKLLWKGRRKRTRDGNSVANEIPAFIQQLIWATEVTRPQ